MGTSFSSVSVIAFSVGESCVARSPVLESCRLTSNSIATSSEGLRVAMVESVFLNSARAVREFACFNKSWNALSRAASSFPRLRLTSAGRMARK